MTVEYSYYLIFKPNTKLQLSNQYGTGENIYRYINETKF